MLSFIYPAFLSSLVALAIPVILHLMKRQTAVRLTFPTIHFLTKGKLPNEGKRKLRDIILLIIRLLIYTMVILTAARPVWKEKLDINQASADKETQNQIIFIVDQTASMHGWSSRNTVRSGIENILKESPKSEAALITFSQTAATAVEMTKDHSSLLSELDSTIYSLKSGSRPELAVKEAIRQLKPGFNHKIVILSDFQLSTWNTTKLNQLPPGVELILIDTAEEQSENVAIIDAQSIQLPGNQIQVVAELHNYGFTEKECELTIETGTEEQKLLVKVPARRRQKSSFTLKNTSTNYGWLSINDDQYNLDNDYAVWLGDRPAITIIAFIPFENEPEKREELFFIQKALNAVSKHSTTVFRLEIANVSSFKETKFGEWDGILMLGAGAYLTKDDLTSLKSYADNGGLLLFTPGRQSANLFLAMQDSQLADTNFLRIEKSARSSASGINWLNEESVLGGLFENVNETDLFIFPVHKYANIKIKEPTESVLKFDSGSPALIRKPVGKGVVYASAFSFSMDWSEFQLSSSFLPVLRTILSDKSVIPASKVQKAACGDPILNTVDGVEKKIIVEKPQVKVIGEIPYEINISRSESMVTKQSLSIIRKILTPGGGIAKQATSQQGSIEYAGYRSIKLWQHTATLLAILIIAELLAGYWFDRKERRLI